MEQLRSFIAIELPEGLREELDQLQAELKSQCPLAVKWVDPHSIHLTLKFLGNIRAERVSEISQAIKEASTGIAPFYLWVKGLGGFPNMSRVQVVWVGVGGELAYLSRLQEQIEDGLARLGFAHERRSFTPHLTLARVRDQASAQERQALGLVLASTGLGIDYNFTVNAVNLMKSQLTREGAVYSKLYSTILKKPTA